MATGVKEHVIAQAASNYRRSLHEPPCSQVLLITDRIDESATQPSRNVQLRRSMTDLLSKELGDPLERVEFDHETSVDELRERTTDALVALDSKGAIQYPYATMDRTTHVIYLGDAWLNRDGIYQAINKFAGNRERGRVRVAGSLGFSTGDCRVMSQMGETEQSALTRARGYFSDFFDAYPQGKLRIATNDPNQNQYHLTLSYDTSRAPFSSETGQFDENNLVFKDNFVYVNIPGGESYGTPTPWQETEGQYVAEGVVFTAEKGLVIGADIFDEEIVGSMMGTSKKLIELVQDGRGVPVSEMGLGYYALAGVRTYSDSSILSAEKAGPHIGMGHGFASDEKEAMDKAAGDFHHTDVVLDESVQIIFEDTTTGDTRIFYPPSKFSPGFYTP